MTDVEIAIHDLEAFDEFDGMIAPLELFDNNGIPYIEPLELD